MAAGKVLKVGKPKLDRNKGGRNKLPWFEMFSEADEKGAGAGKWVAVYQWKTKGSAWAAKRALLRRDVGYEVPSGIGKWELAVDWDEGAGGVVKARLWARRKVAG
jgi:hypothetical protein